MPCLLRCLDACDGGLLAAVEEYADADLRRALRVWRAEGASERVQLLLCKQAVLNAPHMAALRLLREHGLDESAAKRPSLLGLAERLLASACTEHEVAAVLKRARPMTEAQLAPHAASDRMLHDLLRQTRNKDDRKNGRRQK